MQYEIEMDIDLPRARVIELFDSKENLKEWQPDLISFEHQSGEPGEVGAKSKLIYKMGKKEVEMIETITAKNLPDEFSGTYEADGVWNRCENRFIEVGENRTRWHFTTEFRLSGFMKLMGFFMPFLFKKQSRQFMEQFKAFAEKTG